MISKIFKLLKENAGDYIYVLIGKAFLNKVGKPSNKLQMKASIS